MGQFEDMVGKTFGRLTVEERGPDDKPESSRQVKVQWWCRCECGGRVLVRAGDLRSANTRSCGCWKREAQAQHRRNGSQRTDGDKHVLQVRAAARARYRAEQQLIREFPEEFDRLYREQAALEDPPVTPKPRSTEQQRIERELAKLQAQLRRAERGQR
jgi:hypothetical protein